MRRVTYIVAIGTLAAAVAGCADPYAPRTGYSQGYNYPAGYSYPSRVQLLSASLRLRIWWRLQPQLQRNTLCPADYSYLALVEHPRRVHRLPVARQAFHGDRES